jgi:hypothetical protein
VSTKRKPGSNAKARARNSSGRVTEPSGSGSSRAAKGSAAGSGRAKATPQSSREPRPDLNVAAVDRLVARVEKALPRGRVRSAFSGTVGLSPNAVTVVGALPGVGLVAVAVATRRPFLLVVAFALMAAIIFAVMRFGNRTRVVAELPNEVVVFTSRNASLEPVHRGPLAIAIRPYFDGRWLKVDVAGDQLFVSKRAYGAVVRQLAGLADDDAEPTEDDDDVS